MDGILERIAVALERIAVAVEQVETIEAGPVDTPPLDPEVLTPADTQVETEPERAKSKDEQKKEILAKLDELLGKGNYNRKVTLNTLKKALKLVEEDRHCKACGGTGRASKGGECVACEGSGERKVLPEPEPKDETEEDILGLSEPEAEPEVKLTKEVLIDIFAKIVKNEAIAEKEDDRKRKVKEIVRIKGGAEKLAEVPKSRYAGMYYAAKELLDTVKKPKTEDLEI